LQDLVREIISSKTFNPTPMFYFRLKRYLHPSDEELRELSGIPKSKGKIQDMKNPNTFHVPKNIDLKVTD